MSELAIFNFQNKKVRVVEHQGQPWFVLRDLLEAMGSSTPTAVALESIKQGLGDGFNDVYPIVDSLGREQQVIIIAEAAATYLIARSNTELGRQLNRFIHIEVLPQIRQKGFYQLTPQNHDQNIIEVKSQLLTIARQQQEMLKQQAQTHSQVLAIQEEMAEIKKQQQEIQWSCEWTANESHQLSVYFWELQKLPPEFQLTSEKINLLYHFLRQWSAVNCKKQGTTKTARQPPYTADSKVALKETLKRLEKQGKNYQQLADFLNENQTSTLSGQGEWTAAKVKRLLNN